MFKQRTKMITIVAGLLASAISSCGFMVTETEITDQPIAPPTSAPTTPEPTEPSAAGSAVAALTPPTNPKTYIEGLSNTGRPNPFEPVPLLDTGGVENGGRENGPTVEGGGKGASGRVDNRGTASRPTPPPPPPPPVDAQAVKVFGVAAVNGRLQAIIRSPKENVTRTVQVGDTIAGNVLVRGIDAYDTTPAVVLEQFGQTVRLTVSQPTTAQGATPPAI